MSSELEKEIAQQCSLTMRKESQNCAVVNEIQPGICFQQHSNNAKPSTTEWLQPIEAQKSIDGWIHIANETITRCAHNKKEKNDRIMVSSKANARIASMPSTIPKQFDVINSSCISEKYDEDQEDSCGDSVQYKIAFLEQTTRNRTCLTERRDCIKTNDLNSEVTAADCNECSDSLCQTADEDSIDHIAITYTAAIETHRNQKHLDEASKSTQTLSDDSSASVDVPKVIYVVLDAHIHEHKVRARSNSYLSKQKSGIRRFWRPSSKKSTEKYRLDEDDEEAYQQTLLSV